MSETWRRPDGYEISTDKARIDLDMVHGFLAASYWSPNVPRAVVQKAIAGSFCFSLFAPGGAQIGLGRVITDFATMAYLGDIFVLDTHQGRGLGKWMVTLMLDHPDLQGLRRWLLGTRDAHAMYRPFGFEDVPAGRMMGRSGLPEGRYPSAGRS